jgi:hypothetical protein
VALGSGHEPGPESLPPVGDLPPFLPPGWQAVRMPAAGGGQALVLCQRLGRRRASAAGVGVLAIVLWAWTAALALGDSASQDRPWIWIMGAAAASATFMAVRLARITEAWQLTPGCLLIGEIRGRGGRWLRSPRRAAALEVIPVESDGSRYHRLSAVFPVGSAPMYEGGLDDRSARALGSWLAARADIPFSDHSR